MNMSLRIFFVIFSISMTLGLPKVFAQTSGTFMVVKGDVSVTDKDGKTDKAKVGKKIFPQDTITAGAESRAKIVMADQNVINISPDTKLLLEKYIYDPANNNKQVVLNVLEGKVRSTVEQKYDGEKNQFHVKTPAAVAGVRGTDFLTSYNTQTKETKIVTFTGKVAVGLPGPGGSIQNPVYVTPGQMSTSTGGAPPTTPAAVPKEELTKMSNSTKAESPKSDDKGPAASGGKEEKKKDEGDKDKSSDKKDSGDKKDSAAADKKESGDKKEATNSDKKESAGNNSEAKSDANKGADGGKGSDANKGPDGNKGPDTGKDQPKEAQNNNSNSNGNSDRGPASASPSPSSAGGGSMMGGGGGAGGSMMGGGAMFDPSKEFSDVSKSLPGPIGGPLLGPQIPKTNQIIMPPQNPYIDSQLQNGKVKLNININKQ